MPDCRLADDYIDAEAERAALAALARDPAAVATYSGLLVPDLFAVEGAMFGALLDARASGVAGDCPAGWIPAADLPAILAQLHDLRQRRALADLVQDTAAVLADTPRPAAALLTDLARAAEALARAEAPRASAAFSFADALLAEVRANLDARRAQFVATGQPMMGVPTGFAALDNGISGLNPGLTLLGGGPGKGKTTLAAQIAARVAEADPVVYVTFENSPQDLLLKMVAARAGLNDQSLKRGMQDLAPFHRAAEAFAPVAARLVIVSGTSRTTLAGFRELAREAMHRHGADRCLLVADYLQTWAKSSAEFAGRASVRERVEALGVGLREVALELNSPVLALTSLNRAQGGYGNQDEERASLDALKESGDLEYAADVVLMLTGSKRPSTDSRKAVTLHVLKNRQGSNGQQCNLTFRPARGTFEDETGSGQRREVA